MADCTLESVKVSMTSVVGGRAVGSGISNSHRALSPLLRRGGEGGSSLSSTTVPGFQPADPGKVSQPSATRRVDEAVVKMKEVHGVEDGELLYVAWRTYRLCRSPLDSPSQLFKWRGSQVAHLPVILL